jgi:autotransporter-associated beta strand protein
MWPTLICLWLALSGKAPQGRAPRRRPAFRRPSSRPHLELLEDRLAPATHVWSGAVSSLWSDARNWSEGGHPYGDPNANLFFPSGIDGSLTSTHNRPETPLIASITIDGDGYTLNGGPISITGNIFAGVGRTSSRHTMGFQSIAFRGPLPPFSQQAFFIESGSILTVTSAISSQDTINPLLKGSGGTLILSGNNTNTAGWLVSGGTIAVGRDTALGPGTLRLAGGAIESSASVTLANRLIAAGAATIGGSNDLTFTGDVQIQANRTLTVANTTGNVTFDGVVYGPGSVTKTGAGTLTFGGTAANTYTGTTTVNEGTLVLNKPDGVDAIAGPLVIGDGVGDPDTAVVSLGAPNQIADTVAVTINSDGLWKKNNFEDGVGSLELLGRVEQGDPPTLTVGFNNRSTTYGGVISGPGTVVKVGTGTWTLTGNNTYTGGTVVNGGTLLVNGSITGPVTVNAGATLGGTGTTGPVTLSPGAVVSPGGAAPGIQRVQDLAFAAGSSYVVQLNGPAAGTGYDQLDVTGSVSLNGATLNASLGFSPAPHDSLLIIKNDGTDPVIGTFAGLPQGASVVIGGTTFRIYYDGGDGNDVELTRNVRPTVTVPGARTAFQNVDLALGGISVTDPDDANLTVTLQVSHGTLTLGAVAGLTVGGNGTSSLRLSGSQAALNAALAGLLYRGALNYSGLDTLTATASDGLATTAAGVAIRVKSLAEQAADLRDQVSALQAAGVLNQGQANSLLVKLNLQDNNGDSGRVEAFLNEVEALFRSGRLSPAQADALWTAGNVLLTGLRRR